MCNLYLFFIVFIVTFNASGSRKRNNYNNKNNGRRFRLLISKKATRGAKKQNVCSGRTTTLHVLQPTGGGGTRISSDRDDRRIFWGLKVSNSGFFLGRRILASIFLGVVSFNAFWNFFLVEGGGGGV